MMIPMSLFSYDTQWPTLQRCVTFWIKICSPPATSTSARHLSISSAAQTPVGVGHPASAPPWLTTLATVVDSPSSLTSGRTCRIVVRIRLKCRLRSFLQLYSDAALSYRALSPLPAVICPTAMQYGTCVSSCQRRCSSLSVPQHCGGDCEEGCVCPQGTFYNHRTHTCVHR